MSTTWHLPGCPGGHDGLCVVTLQVYNRAAEVHNAQMLAAVLADFTQQAHRWAVQPVQKPGGICDGCGLASILLKGPPAQRLCLDCETARIEPPPGPEVPVQGICAGCGTESFVTCTYRRPLCVYCETLEGLRGEHAGTAAARPRRSRAGLGLALAPLLTGASVLAGTIGGAPSWVTLLLTITLFMTCAAIISK